FSQVKEWIFRLTGFLCSLLSLGFGIILTNSRYWRLWQLDSKVVQLVYIGLWEAYYHLEFNISGSVTRVLVHIPVNSTWTISPEFRCAQGLMLLATLIKPVVVIFSSAAIRVSIVKAPVPEIQIFCYKACVLILVISSVCTFISVTWNHLVDIYGTTTFDFPHTFPVRKEALIKKHCTHVFPIGIVTTVLSLFAAIMFLIEIKSLKLSSNLYAQDASKHANQNA
ncbi:rCG64250, partial [Sigmodon hispidus]